MSEFEIFDEARKLTDPVARSAYLDRVCAGDPQKRAAVEKLLAAEPLPEAALPNGPPAAGEPTLLAPVPSGKPAPGTDLPSERVVAGKYKLLQRIGEGGMGTVYVAEQLSPRRKVALKLIRSGRDSKSILTRFAAERQAIALMDHPNIARFFDDGVTETGEPFFVMELIHGQPITTYCDANRLSVNERIELFIPVCLAIEHAHHKGIIHRDIKSTNILVAQYDGVPVAKVIDFGLAKAVGSPLVDETSPTLFGDVVGTLGYMAPEQATANQLEVDARSDIFSLAAVLYELLTGTTPHAVSEMRNRALLEVLRIVREDEPPIASQRLGSSGSLPSLAAARRTDPKRLVGLCRGQLDVVMQKALARQRDRRYRYSGEFADDLRRFLNHEPVFAAPPTVADRVTAFVRKRWQLVSTVALTTVTALLGLGAYSWQSLQAWESETQRIAAESKLKVKEAQQAALVAETESARLKARQAEVERAAEAERAKFIAREAASSEYVGLMGRLSVELSQRSRGWVERSEESIRKAAKLDTPLRNHVELRSLAADVLLADEYGSQADWALREDVRLAEYSQNGDRLAIALTPDNLNRSPRVRIVDTASGKTEMLLTGADNFPPQKKFLQNALGSIRSLFTSLKFLQNDRVLLGGTRWGRLVRWDLSRTPPQYQEVSVGNETTYLYVSRDQTKCVTWCYFSDELKCWATETLRPLGEPLKLRPGFTLDLQRLPHEDAMVALYEDETKVVRFDGWQERPVEAADYGRRHPSGEHFVLEHAERSGSNVCVVVREPARGETLGGIEVPELGDASAVSDGVEGIQFSDCGRILRINVREEESRRITLWDGYGGPARWRLPVCEREGAWKPPVMSGDAWRVAYLTKEGLEQYSRRRRQLVMTRVPGDSTGVRAVRVSPGTGEVAVVSEGKPNQGHRLAVWNVGRMAYQLGNRTLQELGVVPPFIRCPQAFSPNGEWRACVGHQHEASAKIVVLDRSGKSMAEFSLKEEPRSSSAGPLLLRDLAALEWMDNTTVIVTVGTKLIAFTLRSPDRPVARAEIDTVASTPKIYVDLSIGRRNRGWGLGADGELRPFALNGDKFEVEAPCVAPQLVTSRTCRMNSLDELIAVGNADGGVAVFHVPTRRYHAPDRTGHRASVDSLAWIDDFTLVSGGADGTVTLWRTSRVGELERWFTLRLDKPVVGIAPAITGRHLYVALANEPTLRLIDLDALERGLRELLLEEPNPNVSQTN